LDDTDEETTSNVARTPTKKPATKENKVSLEAFKANLQKKKKEGAGDSYAKFQAYSD
jgi:hypothetical protein